MTYIPSFLWDEVEPEINDAFDEEAKKHNFTNYDVWYHGGNIKEVYDGTQKVLKKIKIKYEEEIIKRIHLKKEICQICVGQCKYRTYE